MKYVKKQIEKSKNRNNKDDKNILRQKDTKNKNSRWKEIEKWKEKQKIKF